MIESSAIIRVIQELSLCRDTQDVMRTLRSSVRQLIGADGVTIVLREQDLCYYADEDAIGPLWKGRRFPMSACISGWSMLNKQQVSISDIYADSRIPHEAYRPTFVNSLAMTPIRREDPIGAIGAYWAERHEPTTDELTTLQVLGDSAAIALAHAHTLQALTDASRRKDEFLAMLAHELRNPLGPIRSAAHVLAALGGRNPAAERAAGVIERQMTHLTRILDDLLDAASLIHGRISLQRERLDVVEMLTEIVADARESFAGTGITFEAELDAHPAWVSGDRTRLSQVVENLLDNARKFSRPGDHVRLRLTRDASGYLTLKVSDTGAGIEPNKLGAIFETFAQADTSLDRSRGGLGIGLSIAKALVGLHGGTIVAESDGPGLGAQFTVKLPPDEELPSLESAAARTRGSAEKGRVLVVEDNKDAAHMLRDVLEVSGFDVTVAYTGLEGIEAAQSIRPAIVICDIGLPGADGYAVASRLRASPATSSAKLIAVTGYGSEEDRQRALEVGFDAHLVKPVPPQQLLSHLRLAS